MVMRAVEVVALLVGCTHPNGGRYPIAWCSQCGAWRDPDGTWLRPDKIAAVAREGLENDPKPPTEQAHTRKVGNVLDVTRLGPESIDLVIRQPAGPGRTGWINLSDGEAGALGAHLLSESGASTAGVPTPDAFGEHSAGRPEPESPAPLRGMVSEAIGATMRPTFLLGWLWGSAQVVLDELPGTTEYVDALARLRRALSTVEKELGYGGGRRSERHGAAGGRSERTGGEP